MGPGGAGLTRLDILKEEDRSHLIAYCETWAVFVLATQDIQENGLTVRNAAGSLIPNPTVGIARNASRELRAFGNLFGLSPSAEMALGKVTDYGDGDDNPFA